MKKRNSKWRLVRSFRDHTQLKIYHNLILQFRNGSCSQHCVIVQECCSSWHAGSVAYACEGKYLATNTALPVASHRSLNVRDKEYAIVWGTHHKYMRSSRYNPTSAWSPCFGRLGSTIYLESLENPRSSNFQIYSSSSILHVHSKITNLKWVQTDEQKRVVDTPNHPSDFRDLKL